MARGTVRIADSGPEALDWRPAGTASRALTLKSSRLLHGSMLHLATARLRLYSSTRM